MGQVGRFGNIKFYSKIKDGKPKVQSFSDVRWETSINVEEHKRHGKKPLLEVTSKNSDDFTMTIYFMAKYGVNPWKMLLLLRKYNLEGKVYPLWIGGRRVGTYKYIITKVSNDLKTFYVNGKVTGVAASVNFKEYPYKKGKTKKKKAVKKKTSTSGTTSKSGSSGEKKKRSTGYTRYEVKKGDTLWGLAERYYKKGTKYRKIFNANRKKEKGYNVISNPNKIYVGWVIKIPK